MTVGTRHGRGAGPVSRNFNAPRDDAGKVAPMLESAKRGCSAQPAGILISLWIPLAYFPRWCRDCSGPIWPA